MANGRLKERYTANKNIAIKDATPYGIDVVSQDPFYPRFWPEKLEQIYRPKLSKAKPRGIFVCIAGNTDILLPDGTQQKIQNLKAGDCILGYTRYTFVPSKITAIHQKVSQQTLTLKSDVSSLRGSFDHCMATPFGYKSFQDLTLGEYVGIVMYYDTQNRALIQIQTALGEQEAILSPKTFHDESIRTSLFGGNNRWRGNNIFEEDTKRVLSTHSGNCQCRCFSHRAPSEILLAKSNALQKCKASSISEGIIERVRDSTISRSLETALNCQEVTSRITPDLHRLSATATMERISKRKNACHIQRHQVFELTWSRINSIETSYSPEILYDLTTETGNYIANGFLTHNCDMSDLFGIGIPQDWTRRILDAIRNDPIDRFYLLTKRYDQLVKWSPFPPNCWVGVTATNALELNGAVWHLADLKAKVRYVSLEPLLSWNPLFPISFPPHINWVIIGAVTKHPELPQPKVEWIKNIIEAADKAGVKVFLKNNLYGLLPKEEPFYEEKVYTYDTEEETVADIKYEYRQEMPECKPA